MRHLTPLLLLVAVVSLTAATVGQARPAGGTLTFCSDITYPPEEFYQGTKPAGSDIEIGNAVAKRLGKTAVFQNTGFDGIIAALLAKKCDAVISGMNDTADRRKQVSFIDYLKVGQSLMVQKGNPKHVSSLASLSGKSVSVEVGTTNKAFLDQESAKLKSAGKPTIQIQAFPHDTDAAAALKTGRVDAYFGDSPVVAYYIQKDSSFAFAGSPVNPIPVGIAVRKNDPATKTGIQKAINALYANGTIKRILTKWHMSAFALK
ncbi:MAG TPA: ABC transporter substrate-binding protein [Gaiellaceae bacterium]|nr:ABC transporter substrate-binding protein [Gaiellaceae bacterium]